MHERLDPPEPLECCTCCGGDGHLCDGGGESFWYVVCGTCYASTAPTVKLMAVRRWNRGDIL